MARRSRIGRLSRRACRSLSQAARFRLSDTADRAHGSRSRRLSGSRRACADHSGWREGHHLARSGKTGPSGRDLFSRQWRFLAGAVGRLRAITSGGIGLVALSYRGYAGSSGQPSENGLLQDAAAAYDFASARYSAERIVVWGFSLGTGVAVTVAAEQPVAKLILEAPYTSLADVAASHFRIVPVRLLLRDQFHSDARMTRVTAPLLIMHGENDLTIPIAFGERLFALARAPKRFVRFPEGGHDNLDAFGAIETARQFIGGSNG